MQAMIGVLEPAACRRAQRCLCCAVWHLIPGVQWLLWLMATAGHRINTL